MGKVTDVPRWGPHPNSILGRANKDTRALIERRRREADQDMKAVEYWGSDGCVAVPTGTGRTHTVRGAQPDA